MLSRTYGAPSPAARKGLKVRIVHRGQHWRISRVTVLTVK